jgi:hypothetical protein
MKHIDLRYHFIRWCVNNGIIDMHYIPGSDNFADLFTKPLAAPTHTKWVTLINLSDQTQFSINISSDQSYASIQEIDPQSAGQGGVLDIVPRTSSATGGSL